MELNELEAQLAALQQANEERDFNEQKRGFYDKFGTAFSNNDDVGLALLSRMAQNGVPMQNATMDVVQEVLSDMQQELNQYLSAIQINNQQAQDLIGKVQGMEQAIQQVTGQPPEAAMPPPEAAPPEAAPPEAAPPEAAPPEAAPPEAAPPEAAPPPQPEGTVSDARLKRVKGDDRRIIEEILAKYADDTDDATSDVPEVAAVVDAPEILDYSGDVDDEEEDPYDIKGMAEALAGAGLMQY